MGLGQIGVQRKGAFRGRQTVLAFSSMDEAHDHLAKRHAGPRRLHSSGSISVTR